MKRTKPWTSGQVIEIDSEWGRVSQLWFATSKQVPGVETSHPNRVEAEILFVKKIAQQKAYLFEQYEMSSKPNHRQPDGQPWFLGPDHLIP